MKPERLIRTAVVTGPTGAIGTALCRLLLTEGCTVYAVCRPGSPRAASLPRHPRLHPVFCDASEFDALPDRIPAPADVFFHLAWAHTTGAGRNDMPAQLDNVRAALQAVRSAAALGCRLFVGAGSQAEYGRSAVPLGPDTPTFPETGYGMAKLCAGQMTRAEAHRLGLGQIWLRVLSVYGPHDGPNTLISSAGRALLHKECPALTAGEQQWDYLYAADAAWAFLLAARFGRDGAVYPLGSGTVHPLRWYVERLRDAVDPALPLGFGRIPYPSGQVMFLQADLTALQHDTGFVPQTDFEHGIAETVCWLRKENHV